MAVLYEEQLGHFGTRARQRRYLTSPFVKRDYMWNMKDYLKLRKEELKKRGAKGFTLMEMLIVVAIIAVLIAIAIPIFTSQLENSREATDAANIRSAYAEVAAKALSAPKTSVGATVEKQQAQAGWQNESITDIAGIAIDDINDTDDTVISYDGEKITIDGHEVVDSFAEESTTPQPTPEP